MESLIFISSNTIYKRDLERFGEKFLSKRFNIIIILLINAIRKIIKLEKKHYLLNKIILQNKNS